MNMSDKLAALRDEAWLLVLSTPQYREFKALDDALRQMRGDSSAPATPRPILPNRPKALLSGKRVTNADIADRVLRASDAPLAVEDWMNRTIAEGANIKGENPLANFRSTVSRDQRFTNFRYNGGYYWWPVGVQRPSGWEMATADPDLPLPAVPNVSSSQEGGDGDAPATT